MQNRKYDTKSVVEAGIMCGLIVVIVLISVYVPVISIVGSFILPVPITILYLRHNYKVSIMALFVSLVLVSYIADPLSAIPPVLLFGIIGVTLGYCIKNKKKFSSTMLYLFLACSVGMLINLLIYALLIDKGGIYGIVNNIINQFKESMKISKSLLGSSTANSGQMNSLEALEKQLTPELIIKQIPGVFLTTAFMFAYINYYITKRIMRRLRYDVGEIVGFSLVYIPNLFAAIAVVILCIGTILMVKKIPYGDYVYNTAFTVLSLALTFDGMAVATFFLLKKYSWPKWVIIILLIFTYFPPYGYVYLLIGVADILFDFRHLDPLRVTNK